MRDPVIAAMVDFSRNLAARPMLYPLDTPSDSSASPYIYRRLQEGGGLAPKFKIAPPGGPGQAVDRDASWSDIAEYHLTRDILRLESAIQQTNTVSEAEIIRALFASCQLATFAARLDLAVSDDLTGFAAVLLACLESQSSAHPGSPFFRGWIFYLAGDAESARRELASVSGGELWKNRVKILDLFIQNRLPANVDRYGKDGPWIEILIAMNLENSDDSSAARRYKKMWSADPHVLMPLMATPSLFALGDPDMDLHDLTSRAWEIVLAEASPEDHSDATRYNRLAALSADPGTAAFLVRELFLGYLRRALFNRFSFIVETLGAAESERDFLKRVSADIPDPIFEYFSALKEIHESRLTEGVELFRKIQPRLRDPYLVDRMLWGLPEQWGAPLVNDVQDRRYESWRYWRRVGMLCRRYGWYNKTRIYLARSADLNPYQPDLKEILNEYVKRDQPPPATQSPIRPESDPSLGTEDAFSAFDPEMDRAIAYIQGHPEFVPDEKDRAFWFVRAMELRCEYHPAIEFARRCMKKWSADIWNANLSAKIAWIHLRRLNDVAAAKKQFEVEKDFYNESNLIGYAECVEREGDTAEAEKLFQENDDRYGDNNRHFPLAAFYVRQRQPGKASLALGGPLNFSGPNQRRTLFTQAMTFYVNESYPTLVQFVYEKIIPQRSSWISYDYTQWALSYFVLGKFEKAREIIDEAVKENKTNPYTDYIRYAMLCREKKWDKAAESIRRTTGPYYHKYLPGALIGNIPEDELKNYARGRPMYQSYLSSMYGLLAYHKLAEGNTKDAARLFKICAASLNFGEWHIPIMSSFETGERKPRVWN